MARPKKDINPDTVESLAAIHCTVEEIASVMGCDKRTLERRFAVNIKKGKEEGKSSLRRMMWDKAKQGNVTMMIWLSKQILGYRDKIEEKVDTINSQPQIVQVQWADEEIQIASQNALPNASTKVDQSVN